MHVRVPSIGLRTLVLTASWHTLPHNGFLALLIYNSNNFTRPYAELWWLVCVVGRILNPFGMDIPDDIPELRKCMAECGRLKGIDELKNMDNEKFWVLKIYGDKSDPVIPQQNLPDHDIVNCGPYGLGFMDALWAGFSLRELSGLFEFQVSHSPQGGLTGKSGENLMLERNYRGGSHWGHSFRQHYLHLLVGANKWPQVTRRDRRR